jgi:predicted metallo-beta-lactamase superfamily hydrolase
LAAHNKSLKIEILGAESLGVRGLSCFVRTKERRIVIDPGVALGYLRHGLLPHPLQVAACERTRNKIRESLRGATDVVLSHLHGDHVPLPDANPYQLKLSLISDDLKKAHIWVMNNRHLSNNMKCRFETIKKVVGDNITLISGEVKYPPFTFFEPIEHGENYRHGGYVMLTMITEGKESFVHASDMQLLSKRATEKIIEWHPNIVLTDGPSFYLPRFPYRLKNEAAKNALKIAENVDILIIDHHALRSRKGEQWVDALSRINKNIMTAADFMNSPRRLLEADRERLYFEMPVEKEWHERYAKGQVTTDKYKEEAKKKHRR